ncbi:uncharacterized protein LOC116686312 [Etheostoma spectabile]|uniref:uncharacterized protein LOC116686312 n=1 Tax=Etheostoma spectabile TaxID=54343 RepID=UPI0013AE9652|nr:uncharacterized protein LOC116686312 [Etheostoma spectabile]
MSNNSKRLLLEVPLFTHGYKYKDITLKGFFGTFELLIRDHQTLEVQNSTVKTCRFSATELIVCSADGRITVVADLPPVITSEGVPARINLLDRNCVPKEMDGTRALFSFWINSCGSSVKLGKEYVTYENEIFFSKKLHGPADSSNAFHRVTMQCTYPLAGLLSVYRFRSDTAGVGRIIQSAHSTEGARGSSNAKRAWLASLNTAECAFSKSKVKFLRHILADGIRPDPEKTRAVLKMDLPHNISELRNFLGMINQPGKYVPKLAEKDKDLRDLLSKKEPEVLGA